VFAKTELDIYIVMHIVINNILNNSGTKWQMLLNAGVRQRCTCVKVI